MTDILSYTFTGILFGLSAGFSPGPLSTLVISETLRHRRIEGIKVALVPLLTDLPIILISIFLLSKIGNSEFVLGIISVLGAGFVAYLGVKNLGMKGVELHVSKENVRSIQKGIVVNVLSPHPYIFWVMVGAPTVLKAHEANNIASFSFVIAFYILLVGAKLLLALLVDKSRGFLSGNKYIWTMRILGLSLIVFAAILVKEAASLWDII
ncbi:MAG: LysE family translocator [Bacteroidales bacterium]|nr:LysE family translocator [Bacteroidales bacterium]